MPPRKIQPRPEIPADPFREAPAATFESMHHVLGGRVVFESASRELLQLADWAYAGLPRHRLGATTPTFRVTLRLTEADDFSSPPPLRMHGGAGLLCGSMNVNDFAVVSPAMRRGLVSISRSLLRHRYHARYEMLEFAVFTLAARAQGLIPFHAACVGFEGRGALLAGTSGAGKSLLALHCSLAGGEMLTEDATFITPAGLATGVANFLHVRRDSLALIDDVRIRKLIRQSPVIERRSGVKKYEVDLRHPVFNSPAHPLPIAAMIFVSPEQRGRTLRDVSFAQVLRRLRLTQAYAMQQPTWPEFERHLKDIPIVELRRTQSPRINAQTVQQLLKNS